MKVTTSLPESRSTESASSSSYYIKGTAVVLATGAAYAVAKTTGVMSWLWSGIEAYTSGATVSEDKAVQTISSAVQNFAEADPLLTSSLKSSSSSVSPRRVEEFDSLDLVEVVDGDRELDKDISNPVTSKKIPADESGVIHLDTQKGIKVPHESRYIGRRLLMTPDAEFIVNNDTLGNQSDPAVATSRDGGFVISWARTAQNGMKEDVYAQIFDASLGYVGVAFRAGNYTVHNQSQSSIAMMDDGSFYISWTSYQDVDSIPLTNPCLPGSQCATYWTSPNTYNHYTAIPACTWGLIVAYASPYTLNTNEVSLGIYFNHFSNISMALGAGLRVNTYGSNHQQNSAITTLQNGDVLIVWESSESLSYSDACYSYSPNTAQWYMDTFAGTTVPQDGSGFGIFARRFSLSSNYGPDFQINSYIAGDQRLPSVSSFSNGETLITWQSYGQDTSGWGIFAQRFSDSGGRIATEFEVNNFIISDQSNPVVTTFSNGGFAIVWQSHVQDSSGWGIFARLFDNSNSPLGDDFQVNTYWIGDQMSPAIVSFQSGEFIVVWQSYAQDGSGFGIYGQRFSQQGVPFNSEFQINTYTFGDQADPAIAAWGVTGSFIVSWDSYLQDGNGTAVIAKVYHNDVTTTLFYADPFNIIQHGNITITPAIFNISGDHPSTKLTITIADLQHAVFQLQGRTVTQFSEQDILNGAVVLLQDGSADTPSFNFTGSDGFYSIGPFAANVNFTITQPPAILNNSFYVLQGRTQQVTLDNLSGFDPRPGITSADLIFTISITGAQFSLTGDPTQAVTQFTQAQINSSQVELTQDGTELIPFGTVSITDTVLTSAPQPLQMVLDTRPTIINDRLSLKPDETVSVTPSDILTSDDRTLAPSLILTVSNVTEGYFARVADINASIFSFTQDDINLEKIIFIHTGNHHALGFLLTVTDSVNLTAGPQSAQVTFDDPSALASFSSYRNTIIYAAISGTIGLCFFAFKFWMSYKGARYLENAVASESGDQAYQKKVIKPIAKEILAHIKMTGFLGYIKDRTMKQAYAAIVGLVRECAAQGVEVDLRKLSDASQTFLIATIAQKTREILVPAVSYCSTAYPASFFRPEVTPTQITGKKTEIATAVKEAVGRQSIVIPKDSEIKESDTHESKAIVKGKLRSDDSSEIELDVMTEQPGERRTEGTEGVSSSPRVSRVSFLPAIQSRLISIEASLQALGKLDSRVQALESTHFQS